MLAALLSIIGALIAALLASYGTVYFTLTLLLITQSNLIMSDMFFNFLATLIGGACTIAGVYINAQIADKKKKKEEAEESERGLNTFKEVLIINIVPRLHLLLEKTKKYKLDLEDNTTLFLYVNTIDNQIKLPSDLLLNKQTLSKTLIDKGISSYQIESILLTFDYLDGQPLEHFMESYNNMFTLVMNMHNKNLEDVYKTDRFFVERDDLARKLKAKTLDKVNYLNIETINCLTGFEKKIDSLIKDLESISAVID